jgi:hypothetical protein
MEFEEMEGMVDVPGLPPVPPSSLPRPVTDKKNPNYTWFLYHGRRFMEADDVIINTAAELEESVLTAIMDGRCTYGVPPPTAYPVGPVLSLSPPVEPPHESVRGWMRSLRRRLCSSVSAVEASPRRRRPTSWSAAGTGSCGCCVACQRPSRCIPWTQTSGSGCRRGSWRGRRRRAWCGRRRRRRRRYWRTPPWGAS